MRSNFGVDPASIRLRTGYYRHREGMNEPEHKVTAIILAAGVAILARMLDALHAVGVRRVVIVVGHCADQVRALAATAPSGMTIECIDNPAYQKGSSLSLYCSRDVIRREPTLIMDADVVFPREFLRRLLGSAAPQ